MENSECFRVDASDDGRCIGAFSRWLNLAQTVLRQLVCGTFYVTSNARIALLFYDDRLRGQ
jgi:hypothetical protein